MRQPDRRGLANLAVRQAVSPGWPGLPAGVGQCRAVPGSAGKAGRRPDPAGQTELKNGLSGPGLTGSDWAGLARLSLSPTASLPTICHFFLQISRHPDICHCCHCQPVIFVDKCEDWSARCLVVRAGPDSTGLHGAA